VFPAFREPNNKWCFATILLTLESITIIPDPETSESVSGLDSGFESRDDAGLAALILATSWREISRYLSHNSK
jgi:hypothetical protein